jgi:C4-dicarboxylate transporter, DctQ subunit
MDKFFRAYDRLLNVLKTLSGLVIFGVFVLIVIDVGMSMLNIPSWDMTLGLVEYGLLWFTMLAAPWLARVKGHVFIDAVTELLSPAIQRVTAKIAYSVAFAGSAAFAYYSLLLLLEAIDEEMIDERGADMLQWTLYFPMPFAFAMLAIEFLRYLFGFDDMYGRRTDVREGM